MTNPLTIFNFATEYTKCQGRQERGLLIAATCKIERNKLGWKVPSQSGNGTYIVNLDHGEPFCTCPDFETQHEKCKHIYAVEYAMQREKRPNDTTVATKAARITYRQNWPAYNEAQTHETERFTELLHELCEGIVQPVQTFGRPKLPLTDVVFSATFKEYSMMSGRRAISNLNNCQSKGYLSKTPHYNSIFGYLENPRLTPILRELIEESAIPLKAVETDFAVDSSGFSTSVYDRWYDAKYGKIRSEHKWVKAHLICGVKTHVVTSVEVTPTETADAPQFEGLVKSTAQNFPIHEVSGDKAYSSKKNLRTVNSVGGIAYIPFKNRTTGVGHEFDNLWNKMWHFYMFNRETFLQHYHKRSNAETTFSMIKGKFGGSVRSKTPVAQVNEVLCKVLCHNICVLIQSIYELGLEPTFWAESPVAQKVIVSG